MLKTIQHNVIPYVERTEIIELGCHLSHEHLWRYLRTFFHVMTLNCTLCVGLL